MAVAERLRRSPVGFAADVWSGLQADKLLELAQGRAHQMEGNILELRSLRTA